MEYRWLNPAEKYTADNDTLVLAAPEKTDWFIDPDGGAKKNDAPVALLDTTRGDLTLSVRVEVDGRTEYDAGALFLYRAEDRWIKLAREWTDIGHPAAVSVVTEGVSDDANGEAVNDGPCYLQMSRRGDLVALHWRASVSEEWRMVRLLRFPAASTAEVGLAAQSPAGSGCTVRFTDISFVRRSPENMRRGS